MKNFTVSKEEIDELIDTAFKSGYTQGYLDALKENQKKMRVMLDEAKDTLVKYQEVINKPNINTEA